MYVCMYTCMYVCMTCNTETWTRTKEYSIKTKYNVPSLVSIRILHLATRNMDTFLHFPDFNIDVDFNTLAPRWGQ